jgi:hypothetical protein
MKKILKYIFFVLLIVISLISLKVVYSFVIQKSFLTYKKEKHFWYYVDSYYDKNNKKILEQTKNSSFIKYINDKEEISYILFGLYEIYHGYKINLFENDIYEIKNFKLNNININEGTIALLKTKMGYVGGVIFPKNDTKYRFNKNLNENIDYIYLRFYPDFYQKNIKNIITKPSNSNKIIKKAISINDKLKNDLSSYQRTINKDLRKQLHTFDYAWFTNNNSYYYCVKGKISDIYLWNDEKYIYKKDKDNSLQNITPIYDDFLKYEDDLFIVYYSPNSISKQNINNWITKKKKAFTNNCKFLKIDCNFGKITYILFNNSFEASKYDIKLSKAIPGLKLIYEDLKSSIGHELTHVLLYQSVNGLEINSFLIREGIAQLLNNTDEKNYNNRYSKEVIKNLNIESEIFLKEKFRSNRYSKYFGLYSYKISASFVEYLIITYGIDKFIDLYKQNSLDENECFKKIYNLDLNTLFDNWKKYILNTDFGNLTSKEKRSLSKLDIKF